MPKHTKLIVTFILLTSAFVISHLNFTNYKPKDATLLNKIKSTESKSKNTLPRPDDALVIGYSKSTNTTQLTFETKKTPSEVQKFYKNILKNENWELQSENKSNTTYKLKFTRKEHITTITSSDDQKSKKTIVSVNRHKKYSDNN